MKDLLSEIESYWTTRAEGYSEVNHKELNGMQRGAWLEVLKSQFPEMAKEELKILDIGTGPGFFPVILAEAGYQEIGSIGRYTIFRLGNHVTDYRNTKILGD